MSACTTGGDWACRKATASADSTIHCTLRSHECGTVLPTPWAPCRTSNRLPCAQYSITTHSTGGDITQPSTRTMLGCCKRVSRDVSVKNELTTATESSQPLHSQVDAYGRGPVGVSSGHTNTFTATSLPCFPRIIHNVSSKTQLPL